MSLQNGLVVNCGTTTLPVSYDRVWRVQLQQEIAEDKRKMVIARRMICAVLPGLGTVAKHIEQRALNQDCHLVFHANHSDPTIRLDDVGEVNGALSRLDTRPVDAVIWGNIPMQVLVGLSYRPTEVHMDHLYAELNKVADGGHRMFRVRHIASAEPRNLYDGYVLELYMPYCDATMARNQPTLHSKIEQIMSFDLS
ncbi:MAG TPA: hypothetical protein VH144_03130 [Candidatus Saccharimonadales bacterium]|jgi:hypothetical protein|nr:hypothetical protein [Candidatus Saccharimonadales bacterium]